LSKLAQLELARADYSDDIDAGYRAMAADTEYNREANANSEDRDSEARKANANSEDRDSEARNANSEDRDSEARHSIFLC
jgi:hypothetical protein